MPIVETDGELVLLGWDLPPKRRSPIEKWKNILSKQGAPDGE